MTYSRLIVGLFLILIGLSALTGLSLFKFFFSLLLILIGIRILTGQRFTGESTVSASAQDSFNDLGVFSPLNRNLKSDNFQGGKAVFIFSGGEIDLRQTKIRSKKCFR